MTRISEILVADPVRNIKDGPLSKYTMEPQLESPLVIPQSINSPNNLESNICY